MKLTNDYIHLRVLAIPASGLIFSVSSLVPGLDFNPALDPDGFARVAETVAVANLVGLVGIVILLFGFQALYDYMSDTAISRWAFVGMVSSTAGMGLFLPFIGIFAFAAPVAGRLYLGGERETLSVVVESTSPSNFSALLFGGASILLFVVGSIVLAGCIWRSGNFPKWSSIPYAVASPLIVIPFYSSAVALLGSVLLLASGVWLARSVWRKT